MIGFIPYIIEILFPLVIGGLAFFLYRNRRKTGLILVAVGFILTVVPGIVKLALGGPYWVLWLMNQGYTEYQVSMFQLYLWILGVVFQTVFTILVVAGLVRLSNQA